MYTFRKAKIWIIGLTMCISFGVLLMTGCLGWGGENCCKLTEQQPPIRNTFKVTGAPEVVVRNVSGPIHVVGDSSGEIRLTATETVQGNSADDIARARREVRLATKQDGNRILACVDFGHGSSSGEDACENHSRNNENSYRVRFDFELHVPAASKVKLSTMNEGDIKADGVSGGFDLQNVNGGVELDSAGALAARRPSGDVKATFAVNPGANCSFSTVNGSVHTYFRPNLSALVRYKTLNGEVYTDFPVTTAGQDTNVSESVSRRGRFSRGQIGSGGPEIENGNIFVHRTS